jgi:type II secretory pathway component PulF
MYDQIDTFFAKRSFLANRGDLYEMIAANFAEGGSGRVSTMREIFKAWEIREAARKNSIALIHRFIVKRLDDGMSFSKAISPFIPKEEVLVIEAGEASGRLVDALQSSIAQKKAGAEINSITTAALSEPAMGAVTIFGTSWFCGSLLWPQLLSVVHEEHWPGWALPLIYFDVFIARYWQIVIGVFLLAFLYIWSLPRWTGATRSFFDKIPPWSVYRDRQSASFIGVLGGLLAAGMETDKALQRIERGSSSWMSWHIHRIRRRYAVSGANPMRAFNTGLFSMSIIDLIEDAARNRSFEDTLIHMSSEALPIIVGKVRSMAIATGMVLSVFTGLIFMYQIAVQQSGVNSAVDSFSQSQQK